MTAGQAIARRALLRGAATTLPFAEEAEILAWALEVLR